MTEEHAFLSKGIDDGEQLILTRIPGAVEGLKLQVIEELGKDS